MIHLSFTDGARRVQLDLPDHLKPAPPTPAGPKTRRSRATQPSSTETDALRSAFALQGLELIASSIHTSTPAPKSNTRAAQASRVGAIAEAIVELASDDEAAAVLTIEDGYYAWHLTNTPAPGAPASARPPFRTRRASSANTPAPHVVRIPLHLGTTAPTAARRTRGRIADLVVSRLQILVFKFAGRRLLTLIGTKNEEKVTPGLRLLRGEQPLDWPIIASGANSLPTDRPARILLFVHGTFSSTIGGFGALAATKEGRDLLAASRTHYDAVLAFDHPTLTVTPLENARELLDRLQDHLGERHAVIDIVCHSRGGLVVRSLVEQLLPPLALPWKCPRIVFVGAVNGGTELAEPANWHQFVEFYTNLAAAAGHLLGRIPSVSTAVAGTLVIELARSVGLLVKVLASEAVEKNLLPGLAAMRPTGDFVKTLNQTQAGQPTAADTLYYAITSDFSATLAQQPGSDSGLPKRLLLIAADRAVDRLMRESNDLVVNVAAMTAVDPHTGGFIKDTLAFEQSPVVHHTNYFQQPGVAEKLAAWLLPARPPAKADIDDVGSAADLTAAPPPLRPPGALRKPPASKILEDRSGGFGTLKHRGARSFAAPAPPRNPAPESAPTPAVAPAAGSPPAPADVKPVVACHLRAEVNDTLLLGRPATVDVTLSREVLGQALRSAHVDESGTINPDLEITVEILPRKNIVLLGDTRVDTPPPPPGEPLVFHFDILPTHPGLGEVIVRARQRSRAFATVELPFTIVSDPASAASPHRSPRTVLAPELAPVLQPSHQLSIFESERGGRRYYQFIFDSPVLGRKDRFESRDILGDILSYTQKLHKDIEEAWTRCGDDPENLQDDLRELGANLWDDLIPDALQALLWTHRHQITEILVFAEEPYIPWELVHLKPPGGALPPDEIRFFGQLGLVRCFHGCGWPVSTLRARKDRCFHLHPDYRSPGWELPETAIEMKFLKTTFGSTAVPPNLKAVRDFFKSSAGFDLFHVAAHGQADSGNISDACILLEGSGPDDAPAEAFRADLVRHAPRLDRGPGRTAPIVFLNSCQTGRAGRGLTGFDGFARRFMEQGAGAFVAAAWVVGDHTARGFVEAFYTRLHKGDTLAAAATFARETVREAGDPTWLAYTVYGNPLARLAPEDRSPPGI